MMVKVSDDDDDNDINKNTTKAPYYAFSKPMFNCYISLLAVFNIILCAVIVLRSI